MADYFTKKMKENKSKLENGYSLPKDEDSTEVAGETIVKRKKGKKSKAKNSEYLEVEPTATSLKKEDQANCDTEVDAEVEWVEDTLYNLFDRRLE